MFLLTGFMFLAFPPRVLSQKVLMHQLSSIQVVVPFPGLTVSVVRPLDFGQIKKNTGTERISLHSVSNGKFTLTGIYHRLPVYISVEAPHELTNGGDSLDFVGSAAFNGLEDKTETATLISASGKRLSSVELNANREGWTGFAYVYLYGYLKMRKAPPGKYTGTCVVTLIL